MKSMHKFAMLSVLLASLAGCVEAGSKSVDWYKQHDQDRKARVVECRNNDQLEGSDDCQNALAAQSYVLVFGKDKS